MNDKQRALLVGLCAALASACMSDSERCGPNMTYDAEHVTCLCAANAVAVEGGCRACADDEVVVGESCACAPGQAKNEANVCAVVAGLGDPCGASQACTDATYSYCAPATAGSSASTCTKTCASDADCGAAHTCATWEAQPYCREFSGVGESCTSQADCAGFDAAGCDTFQTHACLVVGCALDKDDCPRGNTCCDLSAYGAGTACMAVCP